MSFQKQSAAPETISNLLSTGIKLEDVLSEMVEPLGGCSASQQYIDQKMKQQPVAVRSDFASIRKQCLHPTKQDALLGQIASSQITVQKSWSFSSKTKKQKQVACSKKKDFKRLKGENYQDKLATKISSKLLKKQRR